MMVMISSSSSSSSSISSGSKKIIIILLFVAYGCKDKFPISWEYRRMSVFENMVLRGIFGSKRVEVT